LPAAVIDLPQWVAWRFAQREGKWTKVPVDPRTGANASPTNPAHWATFGDALAYADVHGLPGVGFVFAASDPYCGVDLDGCRDPETGELEEWAAAIVDDLASYTELSPSEKGVHSYPATLTEVETRTSTRPAQFRTLGRGAPNVRNFPTCRSTVSGTDSPSPITRRRHGHSPLGTTDTLG
jgi:hypothetical protein